MTARRVGLVQLRTPDTHAAALAHVAPLVREAAAQGAELVLTPEATNILQRDRAALLPQLTTVEDDPVVDGLRALAAELSIELLIGSALVRREAGDGFANRAVLVGRDGAIRTTYDKIHMFDVDVPPRDGRPAESSRESAVYTPGEATRVAETVAGRLGLSICYDVRFPHLFNALARAGAELIATPAAFTRPTGAAHWETLLRARAIETGSFVLAPAQGGVHADGRATFGHTLAVGPWGEVLGVLDHEEPGVLVVEVEREASARARTAIPALANAPRLRAAGAGRMIRYALRCAAAHAFEGWFASSADYDDQSTRGLVNCPVCGSGEVRKAIMAPALAGTKRKADAPPPAKLREMMRAATREVRRHVFETFDDVGPRFATEARAIHEGQAEERGIYGQATPAEVTALKEEGVGVAPLPPEPVEEKKLN